MLYLLEIIKSEFNIKRIGKLTLSSESDFVSVINIWFEKSVL